MNPKVTPEPGIEDVRSFWGNEPCGTHFVDEPLGSPEFFAKYRSFRYRKEHHLETDIDWRSANGQDVLEVGLGLGADSTRWAAGSKSFHGADLTFAAAAATRKHLEILTRRGFILQANAECLPYRSQSFDLVYSHGVLHHTPNLAGALGEIHRVLRPGGRLILMLYARNSLNYWLRIQGYFRLRFLLSWAGARLGRIPASPWKDHLENVSRQGWHYFKWHAWPHHCTDGPDCALAATYSWRQERTILETSGFVIEKHTKAHLPLGARFPALERALARYLGFYQFAWCRKR